MTALQISTIQQLASTLPKCSQRVPRRYTGAQLLELGYERWEGGTIHPERTYMVDTEVATNHVRVLINVLTRKGEDAMLDLVHRLRNGQRVNLAA